MVALDEAGPADAPAAAAPGPGIRRIAAARAGLEAAALVVLSIALFWPGLAALPVLLADEAGALHLLGEAIASGAWTGTGEDGVPRTGPQPLALWAQGAAAWAFGGMGDGALPARLPSMAAAIAAVLLTRAIAVTLAGPAAGLLAGGLAAATLILGAAARLATADALALALVLAALLPLARWWMDPEPAPGAGRTALFWGASALALLADAMIAVMVVLPAAVVLALAGGSRRRIAALDPLRGIAALAAVVVPYAAWTAFAGDGPSFAAALADGVAARTVDPAGPRWPPGAQAVMALATFWPLSALLPIGLARAFARRHDPGEGRALVFLAAWLLPAWIMLETVPVKLPNAMLPLMPALAVLVALSLAAGPTRPGPIARAGHLLVGLGAVALAVGLNAGFVMVAERASLPGIGLGVATALAGVAAAWLLARGRLAAGVAATLVASGSAAMLGYGLLAPALPAALG